MTVVAWFDEADGFRPVRASERPIFRRDCADYAMFYAPGYLCVVSPADAAWFESTIAPGGGGWGGELWRRAEKAIAEAARQQEQPFSPECLTLYMNNECNLRCVYCYSEPSCTPAARLEMEAIAAAAEVVAENCRRQGRPLYGVFHGGGEPTLHRARVEQALALLEAAAFAHNVPLFRYVATNGVMSEKKAIWLARHFDLIGLSCDGPPDVQNRQRPRRDGRATAHLVERTARILREEGCRIHVRTTITGATLTRQAEIAEYVCQQFKPEEIHFEPVYLGGRTGADTGLTAQQAGEFVVHFLQARDVARKYRVLLMTSGSRPDTIHGPYCHVFRETLNLTPGGVATACFKVADERDVRERGVLIGALNRSTGHFEIDHVRVQELRRCLGAIPDDCVGCFNRYHCVRGCPDLCSLDDPESPVGSFRCRVQKAMAYATLREAAERLWSAKTDTGNVYGTTILRSVLPNGSGGN